jgi:starvation-inducible DNA-binding protein
MNEELIVALKKVLADTFVMYYKAQSYHWNVEGSNFPQYHSFLNDLYEEIFCAVDIIAEHIRQIDGYTPTSLTELKSYSMISEDEDVVSAMSMMNRLLDANNLVLASLMMAYQAAEQATEIGLSNFLQDRVAAHQKHGWMLKSITK